MTRSKRAYQAELLELLPRLRRFCLSLTGTSHDADDLLQAAVERLITKPAPDDVELAKWMFRVTKNLWIDEVRSRSVRSAQDLDSVPQLLGPEGEHSILARLTLSEVHSAMSDLPEDQRVALSLVTIEGYAYKDVSEILDIPIGTVMSRLSRARATLVDRFGDEGGTS